MKCKLRAEEEEEEKCRALDDKGRSGVVAAAPGCPSRIDARSLLRDMLATPPRFQSGAAACFSDRRAPPGAGVRAGHLSVPAGLRVV